MMPLAIEDLDTDLVADLQDLLGRPVQVVVRRSLNPLIRDNVLREAKPL